MTRVALAGGAAAILLLAAYGLVEAGKSLSTSLMAPAEQPVRVAAAPPSLPAPPPVTAPPAMPRDVFADATGSVRAAAPVAPVYAAAPAPAPMPRPVMAARATTPACTNPHAMGVTRTVEIDTTGGPGFGSQHFKDYDFLRDHEVVLTFDDGPWPGHTPAVLKALADQCLRATFFSIGKHATYHPEILKMVVAAGHTVGSHTWSHADLQAVMKKSGPDAAKEEIEKGISGVRMMAGAPIAPFFRFPDLRHPPEMVTYLGERNIASFSTDIDSWDFKIKKPEELTRTLIAKVQKAGKGIILMHDFQKSTSLALPQILAQLQQNGFKVVHLHPEGHAPDFARIRPGGAEGEQAADLGGQQIGGQRGAHRRRVMDHSTAMRHTL